VHFLYGSKPKREFRDTERRWFGGILGGHVGAESDPEQIVNFLRRGRTHWFASRKDKNSRFAVHSPEAFYSMFRYPDSVKKTIVYIPITSKQKQSSTALLRSTSRILRTTMLFSVCAAAPQRTTCWRESAS
jgi:hypothetical protein